MSRASIVTERHARWVELLWKHGYLPERPPKVPTSTAAGTVGVRAPRRAALGAPRVVVDVVELWVPGEDPDGLELAEHGCYLAASAWHAQLGEGDFAAERLDVDRSKDQRLMIHRHPHGRANGVRVPYLRLLAPEAWVLRVEERSADLYVKHGADSTK